jgi:CheY-like chemotaxis protein
MTMTSSLPRRPAASKPYTVLLIDDSDGDRRTLSRALRSGGVDVEVREATSASDALHVLGQGGTDCAILGGRFTRIDGLVVLAEAQRRQYDVPFIALTGRDEAALDDELRRAGATFLATQWLEPSRLVRRIGRRTASTAALRVQASVLARERAARRKAEAAGRARDLRREALSHELRNPLSAIVGWSHLLCASCTENPRIAEALSVIRRNAQVLSTRLGDLVDQAEHAPPQRTGRSRGGRRVPRPSRASSPGGG